MNSSASMWTDGASGSDPGMPDPLTSAPASTGLTDGPASAVRRWLAPGQPVGTGRAWGCLALNLLVTPGFGSVLGGWPRSGIVQSLLALAGVTSFGAWVFGVLRQFYGAWEHDVAAEVTWWPMFLGLALFAIAWVWGAITGMLILQSARRVAREGMGRGT